MNNYAPFITTPTSFKINSFNIICYDDMGHINYHDQDDNTKILSTVMHNFMQQIIKKYIDTKYETKNGITICINSLKPELKKKFKYTFTHQNDVYVINMFYDL